MGRSKRGERCPGRRTKQRHDISEVPEATTHARTRLTASERNKRMKARKRSQNKKQNVNRSNEDRSNIEEQNVEQNVNIGNKDRLNIEEHSIEEHNIEQQTHDVIGTSSARPNTPTYGGSQITDVISSHDTHIASSIWSGKESREWARRKWKNVPYLARQYRFSHDRLMYRTYDAYYNDIIGTSNEGDIETFPIRSNEDDDTVRANDKEPAGYTWAPFFVHVHGYMNQVAQDNGIIYERHSKGIPLLHIWDVKRLYGCGSKDQVNCSWKLVEVTEDECKLEIDKKTIKFSFANNDTDKLVFQVIDGYEVKYMLRTDAMRLKLEIELVLSTLDGKLNLSDVCGEIKLGIEPDCEPYTIALLNELHPSKNTEEDHFDTFNISIIRIVPCNLRPYMRLGVDSDGSLHVRPHPIFMYNIPVDQHEQINFKNGYIRLKVFWGCCLGEEKGVCTGVCTCEAGEFIGFPRLSEVGCSSTDE